MLVFVMASSWLNGQDAALRSAARGTTSASPEATTIQLGDNLVPLRKVWKFEVGDSPIDPASRVPLWAEPGFDDSSWENVDLTPERGAIDPVSGLTEYVPGWTGKGHAHYWGFAWYRIRIRVEAKPGVKLALAGPSNVDDVYEAYDNGVLVGSFGDFSKKRPVVYFTQPAMFLLPERPAVEASDERVLAFRVWMEPNTLFQGDDVGGFHIAPVLGEAGAVAAKHQMRWLELVRAYALSLVQAVMFGLLGIVALSLILFDRTDRVYLWIGMQLLASAVQYTTTSIGSWTQWIGAMPLTIIQQVFIIPLVYTGWVMTWRLWFRLRKPTWMPKALAVLVVLLMVSNALGGNIFFTFVSQSVSNIFTWMSIAVRLILVVMMLSNVIQGIRREGIEGWLVLPAVILGAISGFSAELRLLHVPTSFFLFGSTVTVFQLSNLLLVATLSVLLLRRLVVSIRTQRRMALDVKQAQEVQQVILPQARTKLQGLIIESEYRPAREVGGDFFQIIPNASDGSLLIVAGDVTGKGLKAGMLVALLVGAIRSTAELNSDPDFLLRALNRRLQGRGDAHATCLALRLEASGDAKLANAGHMPPYLNGQAIGIDGSFPLGMVDVPELSITRFQMKDGDRLMLISDGIVEATDANGHLFGFQRVEELLRGEHSAAELAGAAQSFGQEDDISVICVTRTSAMEPTTA
jgi:Stage II sporulation protein E (SpoIIE)